MSVLRNVHKIVDKNMSKEYKGLQGLYGILTTKDGTDIKLVVCFHVISVQKRFRLEAIRRIHEEVTN